MKQIKFHLIILPFLFFLFSCEDEPINMLTKINPDGSCIREFTVEGDSAFMLGDTLDNNPFPFNLDSSWTISWSYLTDKRNYDWPLEKWTYDTASRRVYFNAERHFQLVSGLNDPNFFELTDWKSFHPEVNFEKKFKWFYTYFQFKERYPSFKPFDNIPISEFLEEEEVRIWFQGDDAYFNGMNGIEISERLSEIEKEYEIWFERNYFEDQFQVVLNHFNLIEDPKVKYSEIIAMRDSIFKQYRELEDDFPELLQIMDATFKTTGFSEKIGKDKDVNDEVENLFNFVDYYEMVLSYKLLMPGKILKTNSSHKKGDTLSWKVNTYRFTINDYEIYAESRKPNIWAFVVSGIFILGVVLSYFVSFRGRS